MSTFIVHEVQRVRAIRAVEAETSEAAYQAFCDGEGEPCGKDGDVINSDLVSVTEDGVE